MTADDKSGELTCPWPHGAHAGQKEVKQLALHSGRKTGQITDNVQSQLRSGGHCLSTVGQTGGHRQQVGRGTDLVVSREYDLT